MLKIWRLLSLLQRIMLIFFTLFALGGWGVLAVIGLQSYGWREVERRPVSGALPPKDVEMSPSQIREIQDEQLRERALRQRFTIDVHKKINGTTYAFQTNESKSFLPVVLFGTVDTEEQFLPYKDSEYVAEIIGEVADLNLQDFWFDPTTQELITLETRQGRRAAQVINYFQFSENEHMLETWRPLYSHVINGNLAGSSILHYLPARKILVLGTGSGDGCGGGGTIWALDLQGKRRNLLEYTSGCVTDKDRFGGIVDGKIVGATIRVLKDPNYDRGAIVSLYTLDPFTGRKTTVPVPPKLLEGYDLAWKAHADNIIAENLAETEILLEKSSSDGVPYSAFDLATQKVRPLTMKTNN